VFLPLAHDRDFHKMNGWNESSFFYAIHHRRRHMTHVQYN
jgi:hypothetical protein